MNHKIKRKWIAALRGGNYKQIFGELGNYRRDNHLCALGVLCAISTGEYLSMNIDDGNNIIRLNDREHKSFSEIADWIEENIHEDMQCSRLP